MPNPSITNQSKLGASYGPDIANGYDILASQPVLQETGGTLTTDGNVQVLWVANAPMSTFEPRVLYIDLDDMVALDSLDVRVYYRIAPGGGWALYDMANYLGADGGLANGVTMIAIEFLPCRFGVEVTVQQTVGAADLPWSVIEEL